MKTIMKVAALAALVLALTACSQDKKTGSTNAPATAGKTLADVNGTKITDTDFKAEASELSPNAAEIMSDPATREKFLDNLVAKKLIAQMAEKKGYDKDPDLVRILSKKREDLLMGVYVKKEIFDKANVTDAEVKDYFDKNKQNLGAMRLSHIVLGSEGQARDIQAKAKAGAPFDKLAKEFSLDPATKAKGGDLGFVKWADLGSQSLKEATFKLKAGEVGEVVQSRYGYHVVKVTERKPASDTDFDGMKDKIKDFLSDSKKKEMFEADVKKLKETAKVTTDKEALKSLSFAAKSGPETAPAMK